MQSTVLQNAQQQIPVLIPDTGAQLDAAYAEVRGNQRMSYKERNRRKNAYQQKKALSDHVANEAVQFHQRWQAARDDVRTSKGTYKNIERFSDAWMDLSGTPEAAQKNRERARNMSSEDEGTRIAEIYRILDEFEKMKIDDLAVGTDAQLGQNLFSRKDKLLKGMEVGNLIDEIDNSASPLNEDRRMRLMAKYHTLVAIETRSASYEAVIGSPYYALLRKKDTASLTNDQLQAKVVEASEKSNQALVNYYVNLLELRGKSDYSRGQTVQSLSDKMLAEQPAVRAEQINSVRTTLTDNLALYRQKIKTAEQQVGKPVRSNEALHRSLVPWLDISGTPEAEQENRRMMSVFCGSDKQAIQQEADKLFDRFLKINMKELRIRSDKEFADHVTDFEMQARRGWQMQLTMEMLHNKGVTIEPEREKKLRARALTFETISGVAKSLQDIIKSPYYEMFKKSDYFKDLSDDEITARMTEAMKSGDNALGDCYIAVMSMRTQKDFKRGADPAAIEAKNYAEVEREQNDRA